MKRLFRFLFKFILGFVLFSILWVLLYTFVKVPYTPLMAIRSIQSEGAIERHHEWKSIENISPELQLAVICAEDQNRGGVL